MYPNPCDEVCDMARETLFEEEEQAAIEALKAIPELVEQLKIANRLKAIELLVMPLDEIGMHDSNLFDISAWDFVSSIGCPEKEERS